MSGVMRFCLPTVLTLAAVSASVGCNKTTFRGNPVAPIAIIEGPGAGPASETEELDGSKSYDPNAIDGSGIYQWNWTLVSAPAGSTAASVTPSTTDERLGEVTTDVPGKYVIQLIVRDINDNLLSDPTYYALTMFPITGFTAVLNWDTPTNDVDLHTVNETDGGGLFDTMNDCFFQNLRPDWTPMMVTDGDPDLHHDEVNGFGPETMILAVPTLTYRYHLYTHYFSTDNLGPTNVNVKIYVNGFQVFEAQHDQLNGNEVWDVATVQWTGIDATITPVDSISTY
jgi:hypothetical protein